jgi:hypothetical protein
LYKTDGKKPSEEKDGFFMPANPRIIEFEKAAKAKLRSLRKEIKEQVIKEQKYGMLTPIEYSHHSFTHQYWKFQCDCGNTAVLSLSSVQRGGSVSCGCYRRRNIVIDKGVDITGTKYGMLTAVKHNYRKKAAHYWVFKCDCGVCVNRDMALVINGSVISCGCVKVDESELTYSLLSS